MKTIKFILTVIAVAAIVNVKATGVPSQNSVLILQVRDLSAKLESVEKKAELEKICRYYSESNFTKEMLQEYTNLIVQTQNNLQAIAYSAELASKVKNYAEVFIGIARTAANTDFEAPFYMDVLDLALLKCEESQSQNNVNAKESDGKQSKTKSNKINAEILVGKEGCD